MRVTGVSDTTPLVSSDLSLERATTQTALAPGGASFENVFATAIQQANQADHIATGKVEALASGMSDDLHGTMIAVKEADISMRLVGTIRNRLLDAFTEIWKTSV